MRLDRLIDVVVHDPPDPHVGLTDQRGERRDRHLGHHRHHQRLEQQREPRPLSRPRHLHQMGLVLRTDDPRHARRQVRLVLEEVKMAPGLLLGVVHRAVDAPALRAGEPRSLGEVDPQIKPLGGRVELHAGDLPRLCQTQRGLEQTKILRLHAGSHHRRSEARQALSQTGRYPRSMWRSPPKDACRTLGFQRAAPTVELGRELTADALEAFEVRPAPTPSSPSSTCANWGSLRVSEMVTRQCLAASPT